MGYLTEHVHITVMFFFVLPPPFFLIALGIIGVKSDIEFMDHSSMRRSCKDLDQGQPLHLTCN